MAPEAGTSSSYYLITGIPVKNEPKVGPYKKVGVRQNIDQWSSNPDNEIQVHLFVMALYRFQRIDPWDKLSYFQVAGKRPPETSSSTRPNVTWDETAADMKGESIKGKSYCTHNTILFPAWHRPYLALYEVRKIKDPRQLDGKAYSQCD
ncbi:hypothetical protein AWENTII_006104 [Aspergillus wentii]